MAFPDFFPSFPDQVSHGRRRQLTPVNTHPPAAAFVRYKAPPQLYRGQSITPVVRNSVAPVATPSTPADTEVGDLIIAFAFDKGLALGSEVSSGWTHLFGADPADPRFVLDLFLDDGVYAACKVATVAGVAVQTPFVAAPTHIGLLIIKAGTFDTAVLGDSSYSLAEVATSAAPDPPALAIPVENCLLLAVAYWDVTGAVTATIGAPGGYTKAFDIAGSVAHEFSVAYKASTTVTVENPGAFTDNITPNSTVALLIALRPADWRDEVPVPVRGDRREEANFAPAWKGCTDRERYAFNHMPAAYNYRASGAPLLDFPLVTYNLNELTGTSGRKIEIANCVPRDLIHVDLTMLLEFTGSYPASVAADMWTGTIRATDDAAGTPAASDVPGTMWYGQELNAWDPARIDKRLVVRITGLYEVTKRGVTRLEFMFKLQNNGSSTNRMKIFDFNLNATRFPTAIIPATPALLSLNFDLADTLGGDIITVTGTSLGGATSCTVGGTAATILANTGSQLTFVMPAKAAGSHNVQVVTAYGTSNTLSLEAWSPLVEPTVVALGERPGYVVSGVHVDFTNIGSWTLRVGTAWSKTGSAPNSSAVIGGPSGGEAVFPGTGGDFYLPGPAMNALFDLTGASAGSFGTCVNTYSAEVHNATIESNPMFFSDGNGAGSYGCGYSDRDGLAASEGVIAFVTTDAGKKVLSCPLPLEGDYHAVLYRFADGAGATGTFNLQVDGKNNLGVDGFESVTGFTTMTACSDTTVLGIDTSKTRSFEGAMRAFFFATSKVSDAFATKWLKWCRVRHGAA